MVINNLVKNSIQPPQDEQDVVISVEGVSKKFCRDLKKSLLYGVQDIAGEVFGGSNQKRELRPAEFWALKDVSFQLRKGESLGLVGPNGSGKTTLLRIISGLIKPDSGKVKVKGRLAPLLAAGVGFNPILTGRENIYANMSILGLSNQEIDERFDEVVAFAEIPEAIDAPVQSYSSGMQARLGFACAIHVEPEILLIDEALAVGDINFKLKCYQKLAELREKGVCFILVSHGAQAILSICDHAFYLLRGKMVLSGEPETVMVRYEQDLFGMDGGKKDGIMYLPEKSVSESLGLDITYIGFKNETGDIIEQPVTGQKTFLCVGYKATTFPKKVSLKISIGNFKTGERVLITSSLQDTSEFLVINDKEGEIKLEFPYFCLAPGVYGTKVSLYENGEIALLDAVQSFRFQVKSLQTLEGCSFYQPRQWKLESTQSQL